MANNERPWLRDLAHIATIASLLVTLGIVGALAVGFEAFLGVVWGFSPLERILLGACTFFIALGLVLAGLETYVLDRRRLSRGESRQLRKEIRQLKAENKRLESENEWLRAQIPQPNDEELIKRSRYWSDELLPFLENRAREEPQAGVFSAEVRHHQQETIAQYNQRFAGLVGALLNDLEVRGWCTAKERKSFENPIMLLAIQQIANRLAAIGHKEL